MQAELENHLLTSVDYLSFKVVNEPIFPNAFYPTKEDLVSLVWIELLKRASLLESIWAKDGNSGVDKFVLTVVYRVFLDFKRRQDVRKNEILAVSLDQPVRAFVEGPETEGSEAIFGDLLWEEPRHDFCGGPSMWAFEPEAERVVNGLQVLSPEERSIWRQVTLDGCSFNSKDPEENVRATYSQGKRVGQRISKTQANLMFRRARAVAEPILRKSFDAWHAILTPYVYRIDKTACGGSTCSRQTIRLWRFISKDAAPNVDDCVVRRARTSDNPYRPYDPAPPEVNPTKRVRAKRECVNAACTFGLAIDKDNFILPANWRHVAELKDKPVRYLPAKTAKFNTLCVDCQNAISQAEKRPVRTADFSADFSLSPKKSGNAEKDFSCLTIATQQSEPLTLGA